MTTMQSAMLYVTCLISLANYWRLFYLVRKKRGRP